MVNHGCVNSLILLWAAWCANGLESAARAQDDVREEYEVKTAYLFRFGSYIEWPKPAVKDSEQFTIGILGPDPSDAFLKTIVGKMIQDKKIVFRRFEKIDDYQPCQVLFITAQPVKPGVATGEEKLKAVLAKVKGTPTVVITEQAGLARGAVINFYLEETAIRFEINPAAAKRAGVQISSKLLKVGKIVDDE